MIDNYVFTQTKEVVMTADKTVTILTEKLEEIDVFGHRRVIDKSRTVRERKNHMFDDFGRVA